MAVLVFLKSRGIATFYGGVKSNFSNYFDIVHGENEFPRLLIYLSKELFS